MEASAILDEVRTLLDDELEPYLWSDATLMLRLNTAVAEVCIRARVIKDSTSAVTSIALVAGTAVYAVDPAVFMVGRARVAGERNMLTLTNAKWMDANRPGWDDATWAESGTPEFAVFDLADHTLRVHPIPADAGTLSMTVWRQPLESEKVESDTDEPAIPANWHGELKHHILFECYSDMDSEKRNPERAAQHYALFEQRVGRRPSAHELQIMSTMRNTKIRAHYD